MKLESFGTLLYRKINSKIEVLLVHPSGKPDQAWSIPKGNKNDGEKGIEAAARETLEETGVSINIEDLHSFGYVVYKSKKVVHCYAAEVGPEIKPICNSWEVDKAEFIEINKASTIIHKKQAEFISKLIQQLKV
jgi:predicted NUDIX family NTP pyrophosphohydrolase